MSDTPLNIVQRALLASGDIAQAEINEDEACIYVETVDGDILILEAQDV